MKTKPRVLGLSPNNFTQLGFCNQYLTGSRALADSHGLPLVINNQIPRTTNFPRVRWKRTDLAMIVIDFVLARGLALVSSFRGDFPAWEATRSVNLNMSAGIPGTSSLQETQPVIG